MVNLECRNLKEAVVNALREHQRCLGSWSHSAVGCSYLGGAKLVMPFLLYIDVDVESNDN